MRIQTNIAAADAYRNLAITNNKLASSVAKLSSGFRINRAGDDVAGLAVANSLRSEGRALQTAQRNATQASAVLQIADGSVSQISQITDRMRELAMQAGSDNTSDADRANLDAEFQSLIGEIDRIVDETTYQGNSLIDGSFSADFLVGTGSGATVAVDLSTLTDGVTVAGLGLDSTDITSKANATTALAALTSGGTAQTRLNAVIGAIGAAENRLDYAAATLAVRVQNVQAAESVIRDTDVAQEMTQFTKLQILQQAGTAMLAQANSTPQSVLTLLRG
jgi:flagellin